ncbi:MAG: OmpA family protein [Alphaproteobacteria bacterium]|nr:OmpA family protein [Alphaproteobacteria bacterium]
MTVIFGGPDAPMGAMPLARPLGHERWRALCTVAKHGFWVIAAILVAGCSGGFDKYFGTDKAPPKPAEPKAATEQSTDAAQEVPGKEQAYPNLGSVPQTKPIRQSAQEQTQAVAKGLVADRQNARYTDEVIRRDPVQAAAAPRPGAATAPKLPTAPGAAGDKAPPSAPEPKLAAAPTLPSAPPAMPTSPPPAGAPAAAPALPAAPTAADAAQPVLPAPQPVQPPMAPPPMAQAAQPAEAPPAPVPPAAAPPTPMLLGTQVAQAITPPASTAPLPMPPAATASVNQPPSVAPSPATAPSMASVAQPQFQPPPPPVIPGYAGSTTTGQPAPQPIAPQPGMPQAAAAYPQQAYPQQPQLAALPPAAPPAPAMARPVLTPPPGYGLPPAASALAPAPSAPYVPTAAPANPIRPPPPPISPALPAMAGRGGAYDPAIAEARARAGGSASSEAAAVAEARRRAAFSPGQQVGLLLFDNGSASLSQADRSLLQRVAAVARQNGAVVRVVGHASSRTGEMNVPQHLNRNLNISEARASAAAAELNAAGLPSERIVIEAKGDSEPLYSEAMPSGEAGNRRVDVFLQ